MSAEHPCCPVTQEERDRRFAVSVRARASKYAEDNKFYAARTLLDSVAVLLDGSGGRECDEGVWLLASHGDILTREGKLAEAEQCMNEALGLSLKLYGDKHPCTGICHMNQAEVLTESGKMVEARAAIECALAILEHAEDTCNYTKEYIAGGISHALALKARLDKPAAPTV